MISPQESDGLATSKDPNQTATSDLGLHCLPRTVGLEFYRKSHSFMVLSEFCVVFNPKTVLNSPV